MYYSDLVQNVRTKLRGCPDVVVEDVIRETVIAFCRQSGVWEVELDPINTVADTATYAVNPPIDAIIDRVTGLKINGYPVSFTVANDYATVTLAHEPRAGEALVPTVILSPSDDSAEFPDFIGHRYKAVIASGAIGKAMEQPGRPWSEPGGALDFLGKFLTGITTAKNTTITGRQSTDNLRVRMVPFI